MNLEEFRAWAESRGIDADEIIARNTPDPKAERLRREGMAALVAEQEALEQFGSDPLRRLAAAEVTKGMTARELIDYRASRTAAEATMARERFRAQMAVHGIDARRLPSWPKGGGDVDAMIARRERLERSHGNDPDAWRANQQAALREGIDSTISTPVKPRA